MKIGISGASGFLGLELLHTLSSENEMFLFENLNRCQIRSDSLEEFEDCDYFIHLAEPSSNSFYTREFSLLALKNAQTLSEFFRNKLIYTSSVLTYGLGQQIPHKEDDPSRPFNNYTTHKAKAEKLISENGSRSLRISNIIGQQMSHKNLINNLIRKIKNNEEIIIRSDDKRDYIEVKDVTEQIAKIIHLPFEKVINIGSGTSIAVTEMANEIAKHLELTPTFRFEEIESLEEESCVPDTSLLHSLNPEFRYTRIDESIKLILNREKS